MFGSLSLCKAIFTARGLASVRRDFPLSFFLLWLLIGQSSTLLLGIKALIVAPFLVKKTSFAPYLVGILTTMLASPPVIPGDKTGETSFLAFVDSQPRYRQVGAVELSLYAIEPPIGRVLCKSVDLPWRI